MRIAAQTLGSVTDLVSGERWTQNDLQAAADRTSALIHGIAGAKSDYVIIAHGGTPAFFGDLLGVWQAGGCAVCIAPDLTAHELRVICDFVRPAAILTGDTGGPDLNGISVPIVRSRADGPKGTPENAPSATRLDDPAIMLFTSGTTGQPKGVVHSFRSVFRPSRAQSKLHRRRCPAAFALRTADAFWAWLDRQLPNASAGRIGPVSLPGYEYPGIQGIGDAVVRHGISFMSSVPAFWRIALRVLAPLEKQTLRRVHIGSAPLSADLWQGVIDWCGTDNVANMYGITEDRQLGRRCAGERVRAGGRSDRADLGRDCRGAWPGR